MADDIGANTPTEIREPKVSAISPNGNVTVVRMDGENVNVLAEHYEGGGLRLPMTITVVDQKNEAVRVTVGPKRSLTYH
jgi:hypothetical protein